jgi:hypothetical protein
LWLFSFVRINLEKPSKILKWQRGCRVARIHCLWVPIILDHVTTQVEPPKAAEVIEVVNDVAPPGGGVPNRDVEAEVLNPPPAQ